MTDWPEHITDHAASGVLEIRWHGGAASRLPHGLLRRACRCGACERLWRDGDGDRNAGPGADDGVRLAAIHPVGDRGLNLVFDDGHGRGIYPWAYLRQLGGAAPA